MSFDSWTRNQAQRLAQTITAQHDEAAHSACLDALEAYITAQLADRDYTTLFPVVTQHLDSCVPCAETYALVYDARVVEAAALPTVVVPEPDLNFLRLRRSELIQRTLAAAIERLAPQRLRFTLSQSLLDLLAPTQPANFAFRSATAEAPLLDVTVDLNVAEEVQIQLSVYPQHDNQDRCTVRARVAVAGREWPDLGDIPVVLTVGDQQQHVQTDPWGEAIFEDVPQAELAGLQLEVAIDDEPQTST